jgi:type IV secretory pathway VirB6-like protein
MFSEYVRAVGGLGCGWGKIKCAAKALACVSACSSFNFAKCLHFFYHLAVRLLSVVSSFRVSANVTEICDGGMVAQNLQ